MYGYIYLTTCIINNKKYIGMHKYNKNKIDESYFGSIKLKIIDEVSLEGVPNLKLRVDGFYSTTDRNGDLNIKIPLKQQKKLYKLNSDNYIFSDNGVIEAPFNSESRVIFAKHK